MGGPVTAILNAMRSGDPAAANQLLPAVYKDLRAMAAQRMAQESSAHTLDATALVHEAYLRLIGPDGGEELRWDSRGHFYAAAAEAMRRILIDHARAKRSAKRGGSYRRLSLDDAVLPLADISNELIDLDQALVRLEEEDRQKAELVKLRFFAGLTLEQAAKVLGISPATADRHWAYARAWLYAELEDNRGREADSGRVMP